MASPSAASLPQASTGKLKPRYFGPYRVSELINDVAVRLDLPAGARLHDVFHVGLLKKFQGTPLAAPPPLPAVHHGALVPEPARAVRYRLARGVRQVLIHWKGESVASSTWEDVARGVRQVLIHWKGESVASSTWEDVDAFRTKYTSFQLEDELSFDGGGDVMWGKVYTRRRRARDIRRAAERAAREGAKSAASGDAESARVGWLG